MKPVSYVRRGEWALRALVLVLASLWASPRVEAQTVSTFDVLVATRSLTVIGTTTIQGSGLSVGVSTMIVANGTVSIGTSVPRALFTINSGVAGNAPTFFSSSFTTPGISSFTVPSGVYQIFAKAWGGGGAGGESFNCNANHAGAGAGGSFASGFMNVTPGEVLTVVVGGGGTSTGPAGSYTVYSGGIGLSTTSGGSGGSGVGSGGGASGLFRVTASTVGLLVAGGGGAGGNFTPSSGINGQDASAIGVGGAGNANGADGTYVNPPGAFSSGGGGGATSGGTSSNTWGGAGATGNSLGQSVIYGSGTAAGNTTDPDYSWVSVPAYPYGTANATVGVGTGGDGGATTCYGQRGNSGAVYLYNGSYQSQAVNVSYSTNPLLTVFNNGFVGIGTYSPQSNLHVVGTTTFAGGPVLGTVYRSTSVYLCGGDQTPSGGQNSQATAVTLTNSTSSLSFAAGSWAEVTVTLFHYADGTQYNLDLFVDNARPAWVGSNGILACQGTASSIIGICSAVLPIPISSAGTHTFYFKVWRGGNPVTVKMGNPCSYYTVKEMRGNL